MSEANDFLMGGGKKSAAFPTIGTQVSGTIVRIRPLVQASDPATGELKFFKNGGPQMQLPIELQTAERLDPDDDGIRALYLKFMLRDAVRDAVRAAGASGLEVGGTLTVTFTSQDPPERPGLSGPKRYSAVYVAPAANFLMEGAEAPAPTVATPAATAVMGAPTTTVAAPVAQQAAAPVQASSALAEFNPVETAKSLIGLNQPDSVIAETTGLGLAVIAAIRNTVPAPA